MIKKRGILGLFLASTLILTFPALKKNKNVIREGQIEFTSRSPESDRPSSSPLSSIEESKTTLDSPPPPSTTEPIFTIAELEKAYPGNWTAQKSNPGGIIESLYLAPQRLLKIDENNALDFIRRLRPLLGSPHAEVELIPGDHPELYIDIKQTYKGFNVYDGKVRILLGELKNPSTIKNQLKSLNAVQTSISFDSIQIQRTISEQHLKGKTVVQISVNKQPLVFALDGRQGELAWIADCQWIENGRLQHHEILASAISGLILNDRDLIIH